MSLKRIPSVGKFLMSRIFALRSATSIDGYLTSEVAVRRAKVSARTGHGDTRRGKRREVDEPLSTSGRAQLSDFGPRTADAGHHGTGLANPPVAAVVRRVGCCFRS